jgi:integrase
MRRAEIFALRWEDVDFDNDVIHVRQALQWLYGKHIRPKEGDLFKFITPKTEDSIREIDLSPELKKELEKSRDQKSTITVSSSGKVITIEPTGLIFCTPAGRPLDPNGFQKKEFTNAVLAAQIGKARFHDLRHTYGSWKIAQGEDILYVSAQMGHADAAITLKVYARLLEKRRPAAATKTDEFIFGVKVKPE